uniref:Protein PET100 homolog, mitochondrial n=1 Tax=Coturnix japonica TaxID=93934 RepID=A0A8C2SQB1_COTJA
MGVKLEVFRMLLYLSFPVGVFWVSNQAQYFQQFRRQVAALKQRVLQLQEERALKDTRG